MPTLTFNYSVAGTVAHPAHKLLGGDAGLDLPSGFGRGSHHMLPLDARGRVKVRPGPGHRSIYFGKTGAASTYTAARIAAAEGVSEKTITGKWIRDQATVSIAPYRWGEHPDYALDDSLRYFVLEAYFAQKNVPGSLWFHFERGGTFTSLSYFRDRSGYLRHPIVYKAYGTGDLPVIATPFSNSGTPENNVVFEELDFGTFVDPPYSESRIKTAIAFNDPSRNWLFNHCDFSGKDHTFQQVSRFTLRRNRINDSAYDRPDNGSTWASGGHFDRIQGAYVNDAESFCFLENTFVHSGWKDGYDAVNDPATGESQPPSQYSHGLYVQTGATDMTFRGNVVTYVSSQGAKFPSGAHVAENFWFENPHHFFVQSNPEYPKTNYSTVWGNVCVGSRWRSGTTPTETGIAYMIGFATYYGHLNPNNVTNNAILHNANPNDAAEVADKPSTDAEYGPAYVTKDLQDQEYQTPVTYVGGWLDFPDENISLSEAELNDLTFHYWLDDHLQQARGTATTLDCVDWFRTAAFDYIGHIVGDFLTTLGGPWNASTAPATITFVPYTAGEGWRWDARYNWNLTRRPVDGDTVQLNGADPVVSWENIAPAVLDMGVGANLHVDGGLMNIKSLTGSGTITVIETGDLALGGVSGADVSVVLDDGGLSLRGDVTDGLSITARGLAECVVEGGRSLTIGSGHTLRIEDNAAKVGFDGASGTATITMATGSTLEFVAGSLGFSVVHEAYTGLAGLDAYNRPAPVGVTSNFVIEKGATLNVDVTGLGAATYDLVIADRVSGTFDSVNVSGGSGSVGYTATKVQITVS